MYVEIDHVFFFFFLDVKMQHNINRNHKQSGTSEAIAVSKKLGVSSTHATKSPTN